MEERKEKKLWKRKKKQRKTCTARESNPGRKNGNLAWCHYTSSANWLRNFNLRYINVSYLTVSLTQTRRCWLEGSASPLCCLSPALSACHSHDCLHQSWHHHKKLFGWNRVDYQDLATAQCYQTAAAAAACGKHSSDLDFLGSTNQLRLVFYTAVDCWSSLIGFAGHVVSVGSMDRSNLFARCWSAEILSSWLQVRGRAGLRHWPRPLRRSLGSTWRCRRGSGGWLTVR